MGRSLRFVRRALAVLALLLIAVLAAAIAFTRTPRFNQIVQARLAPFLATTFKGQIAIESIQGSWWGDLKLHGVTLRYGGTEIIKIPEADVSYALMPLLWRSLHLRIALYDPLADLVRDHAGNWNLLEALSPAQPSLSSAPLPFDLEFDEIDLHNGAVEIAPTGLDGRRYRLARTQLTTAIELGKNDLTVAVDALDTIFATAGMPAAQTHLAGTYAGHPSSQTLTLSALRLSTAASEVALTGTMKWQQPMQIDAKLAITRLAATDLASLLPAAPLAADLSGTVQVTGPLNALAATVALGAGGAALAGELRADLSSSAPRYDGKFQLANADLQRLTKKPGWTGLLKAKLAAKGAGLTLAATTAQIDLSGRSLAVSHYPVGELKVTGSFDGQRLQMSSNATSPAGRIEVSGVTTLSADPKYDFKLDLRRFDFAQTGLPGAVPTSLNLDATVAGGGIDWATIDTRIATNLTSSQVAGAAIRQAIIDARVVRGQAQIARASFTLDGATLDLRGVGGLIPGTVSQLVYTVQASSVAHLLKLAQVNGDGHLNASGTVSGPREKLRTTGALTLTDFHSAGNQLQAANIKYDLTARGPNAIAGGVDVHLVQVHAGFKLQTLDLAISSANAPAGPVKVILDAEDASGGEDHLAVVLNYRARQLTGHLNEAVITLPDGSWRLAAPVAFSVDPRGISLTELRMRNAARELVIAGKAGPAGPQDFKLAITNLSLADFTSMLGQQHQVGGSLSANLHITGSAAAPSAALAMRADRITIDSHRVGDLNAQLSYLSSQAKLDATLREDKANAIDANGTISAAMSWTNGFTLRVGDDLDLRLVAPRLDLAKIAALAPNMVRDFQGVGAIDLKVTGAITHPAFSGNVRVAGVKGEIVPLGVALTEAHARIDVDPQRLAITTFAARAGSGSLNLAGAIAMHAYNPQAVELSVKFDQWPAIATKEYQAIIGGELAASGSLDSPRLTGAVTVLNATIQPDLAFLTASSRLAPDETIMVIQPGEGASPAPGGAMMPPRTTAPSSPSLFKDLFQKLAIDTRIRINRDTWIRHEFTNVELEGRLHVTKLPQGPVRVVGALETVHGWIIYKQKRFDLQPGAITFTGDDKINPELSIDARYTLPDYLVDILVTGTADSPALQLKSQPDLPQADILSLILFGKTTAALNQGQQQSLQQQALQMAGGYAAGQIGEAVAQSLGLQDLGFQFSGASTSGGSLGFGRYFGSNTYVSASDDLGGSKGRQVSLQYFLLRWLSITTSTSSSGGSEIDLNFRKQY